VKLTDTVSSNKTGLHSKPARRTHKLTPLSPIRIIEQAITDIRKNICRNLEAYYSSESSPKLELYPNINIERKFPFDDINPRLINHNGRDEDILHPTYARSESKRKVESLIGESFC